MKEGTWRNLSSALRSIPNLRFESGEADFYNKCVAWAAKLAKIIGDGLSLRFEKHGDTAECSFWLEGKPMATFEFGVFGNDPKKRILGSVESGPWDDSWKKKRVPAERTWEEVLKKGAQIVFAERGQELQAPIDRNKTRAESLQKTELALVITR